MKIVCENLCYRNNKGNNSSCFVLSWTFYILICYIVAAARLHPSPCSRPIKTFNFKLTTYESDISYAQISKMAASAIESLCNHGNHKISIQLFFVSHGHGCVVSCSLLWRALSQTQCGEICHTTPGKHKETNRC